LARGHIRAILSVSCSITLGSTHRIQLEIFWLFFATNKSTINRTPIRIVS
jgi:hypothetical protein